MNKKMLTLAVAAAMAVPAAAIADATLYGRMDLSIDYIDVEENANWARSGGGGLPGVPGFKGSTMNARGPASRLGVKGSEDLGFGLKAIYQIEMGVQPTNATGNGNIAGGETLSMRNTFAGLAGDWGSLIAGRHDTPMKISTGRLDLFADTLADFNNTIGFDDLRVDNSILYASPSFAGFQFSGQLIPAGGATFGGFNTDADGLNEGWSVAAIYRNGPFFGSLAYETFSSEMHPTVLNANSFDKWRFGLGLLDWNGFTLAGVYENWTDWRGNPDADADLWTVQAGYAFGNNMIKAMYGQADLDSGFVPVIGNDNNKDAWAVGFDHNFTKRTKAYLLYTQMNDDARSADWDGFSLGMVHRF